MAERGSSLDEGFEALEVGGVDCDRIVALMENKLNVYTTLFTQYCVNVTQILIINIAQGCSGGRGIDDDRVVALMEDDCQLLRESGQLCVRQSWRGYKASLGCFSSQFSAT